MRKRFAILLFLNSTVLALAGWEEGDRMPDLSEFELSGELPALKGKVTYVDFWASWCAPCKASFPLIDELYQKHKDEGFQVLAISVDRNPQAMETFLKRLKPTFAVAHDSRQSLVENAGIKLMPTSYLVDVNGVIRGVHSGWKGNSSAANLEVEIIELLAEI